MNNKSKEIKLDDQERPKQLEKFQKSKNMITKINKNSLAKNKDTRNHLQKKNSKDENLKIFKKQRVPSYTQKSTTDENIEDKNKEIPLESKIISENKENINIEKREEKPEEKKKNNKKNSNINKDYINKVYKNYNNIVEQYNKEKVVVGIINEKKKGEILTPVPKTIGEQNEKNSSAMFLFKKAEKNAHTLRKLEYDSYLKENNRINYTDDGKGERKNKTNIGSVIDNYNKAHPNDPIMKYTKYNKVHPNDLIMKYTIYNKAHPNDPLMKYTNYNKAHPNDPLMKYTNNVCKTVDTADTYKSSNKSIIKSSKGRLSRRFSKTLERRSSKMKKYNIDKIIKIQSVYRGFVQRFIEQKQSKIRARLCAIEMFVWLVNKYYMMYYAKKYLRILEYEYVLPFLKINKERSLGDRIKLGLIQFHYQKNTFEGKDELLRNNIKCKNKEI